MPFALIDFIQIQLKSFASFRYRRRSTSFWPSPIGCKSSRPTVGDIQNDISFWIHVCLFPILPTVVNFTIRQFGDPNLLCYVHFELFSFGKIVLWYGKFSVASLHRGNLTSCWKRLFETKIFENWNWMRKWLGISNGFSWISCGKNWVVTAFGLRISIGVPMEVGMSRRSFRIQKRTCLGGSRR
jgi:hypothetical protein